MPRFHLQRVRAVGLSLAMLLVLGADARGPAEFDSSIREADAAYEKAVGRLSLLADEARREAAAARLKVYEDRLRLHTRAGSLERAKQIKAAIDAMPAQNAKDPRRELERRLAQTRWNWKPGRQIEFGSDGRVLELPGDAVGRWAVLDASTVLIVWPNDFTDMLRFNDDGAYFSASSIGVATKAASVIGRPVSTKR